MDYNSVCNKNGTDKGDAKPNGNCYADFYQKWFEPIREQCKSILEIGIDNGASLRANYEFFPNAEILGIDILEKSEYQNKRIQTIILDQSNLNDLDNFCQVNEINFDIIIDDGSHDVSHQQLTFGKFFTLLKPGGLYILEDLGTSYFNLGQSLYGYEQTQDKIINNTINFLSQRPFFSPWISSENLFYINNHVEYVSIFDKLNNELTYLNEFNCLNNYPIRSITSIIKKKL